MAALPLRLRAGDNFERGRFAARDFRASSRGLIRKTAAPSPIALVGRREDGVGRLTDCGDRPTVLKTELAVGLSRDRCDEPLAVDTESTNLVRTGPPGHQDGTILPLPRRRDWRSPGPGW
jgi:hypothetical protein